MRKNIQSQFSAWLDSRLVGSEIEKNDIERKYKIYQFALSQEPPRESAAKKRCKNQNVHD